MPLDIRRATIARVGTALIYLVVMIVVAAVIYLVASAIFGRGEELAPLPPGGSPTRLPAGKMAGEDVRAVRFQQVLRGYKMSEVDWVLARLSAEIDDLRSRLADAEAEVGAETDAPPRPQRDESEESDAERTRAGE